MVRRAPIQVIGRGQTTWEEHLPIVRDVALDRKGHAGLMVDGPPSRVRYKGLLPWAKEHPIIGKFDGDGEAIDFAAGPQRDWRSSWVDASQGDREQREADLQAEAHRHRMTINKRESFAAMMTDPNPQGSLGERMVTLTYIVVLVVLAMASFAYIRSQGGLGEVF